MSDRYSLKLIKRNWQGFIIFVIIVIIAWFTLKNIGEIPYENQYLMNSNAPVQFEIKGNEMRGFIYLSYWVEYNPNKTDDMTSYELEDYLIENGYIDIRNYSDQLIEVLKTYNAQEIKENWMDDYEFFKKRNVYFIENDEKLMNKMKELGIDIELDYELKKIFFVYLDQEKYHNFIESLE